MKHAIAVIVSAATMCTAAVGAPGSTEQRFHLEWLAEGQIPPTYRGLDIADVINRVEEMKPIPDDRFATSEENTRRRNEVEMTIPLGEGVKLYDLLALPAQVRDGPAGSVAAVMYSYDADKEQLHVAMRVSSNEPTRTHAATQKLYPLDLKLERTVPRPDLGQAAWGAPYFDAYYASLGTMTRFVGDVYLSMPREVARREVPKLRNLVFAQLTAPKVARTEDDHNAIRRMVPVLYKGFVVYSGLSGKILGTFPEGMDKNPSLMSTVSGVRQD